MPISSIAIMASGLTRVASVPAENASKQSPDKCLSSPSAIWLLAELWVQRNRTLLFFCGAGDGVMVSTSVFEHKDAEEQSNFRAGQFVAENLAPLLPNQPQVTAGEVEAYKVG